MREVRQTECRSCGDPIVWMRTTTGSNIPVNPDEIDEDDLAWDGGHPIFDPKSHVAHFATCPHADQHRRKR